MNKPFYKFHSGFRNLYSECTSLINLMDHFKNLTFKGAIHKNIKWPYIGLKLHSYIPKHYKNPI